MGYWGTDEYDRPVWRDFDPAPNVSAEHAANRDPNQVPTSAVYNQAGQNGYWGTDNQGRPVWRSGPAGPGVSGLHATQDDSNTPPTMNLTRGYGASGGVQDLPTAIAVVSSNPAYQPRAGESLQAFEDRLRREAAQNVIDSGPGGSFVNLALYWARQAQDTSRGANPYADANPGLGNPLTGGSSRYASQGTRTGGMNVPGHNSPTGYTTPSVAPQVAPQVAPGGPGSAGPGDPRAQVLFPLDDPDTALLNVLRNMGISLDNPIIRRVVSPAAEGLANAFRVNQAQRDDLTPGSFGSSAEAFRDFMTNVFGGSGPGGGAGSMLNTLRSAASTTASGGFRDRLVNTLNLQGVPGAQVNPYLQQLIDAGLLDTPRALAGFQSSLMAPLLGRPLTASLAAALNNRGMQGLREMDLSTGGYRPGDFYSYIMGLGGGAP